MTDNGNQLESTGNPVLDELLQIMIGRFQVLVSKGFLAPHFLSKMIKSPEEVIKFIRQNRAVVADTLNKRLSTAQRPSRADLERMGYVPRGYFSHGHDIAVKSKHRRKSTATQDLEMMLKLRPAKEDIVKKGIANKEEMEYGGYYELDDTKLDGIAHLNDDGDNEYYDDTDNESTDGGSHFLNVSILSSLLFKTISEALKKSSLDTQNQEAIVLQEMIEMNAEMKTLRNVLDQYFLSNDISQTMLHQNDENLVRDKFHSIQTKLVHISQRQSKIHDKLRILESVERSMVSLQNKYQIRLNTLKKREIEILEVLAFQKAARDKAEKIMYAEKSHKSWALMKLDFTINIAKTKDFENIFDSNDDREFVHELDGFLSSLRNISEHQKQIVRDYDSEIDKFESMLMSVRYDMSKVRTMTFKKIYDLHKQVQIAESLDLGINRRLSVASATELDRERRHHTIKIQRQLSTLRQCVTKSVNVSDKMNDDFFQMIDVQHIMSHSKLKCFFCIFLQTMNQTIIDIELTFNNLNSELPPIDNKVNAICEHLYGINCILEQIECEFPLDLNEKLTKCVKFLNKIKNAIHLDEGNKDKKVKTFGMNKVILIIARKICIDWKEKIQIIEMDKMGKYAEKQTKIMFETVLNGNKIFESMPRTKFDAASQILRRVYKINATQMNI